MDAVMLKGDYVQHRYPPHAHDTHCLAVVTSGAIRVEVGNQRRICRRGDIVLIGADAVHSGDGAEGGRWKMRVAHVEPGSFSSYSERLGLRRGEGLDVKNPFIVDQQLFEQLYGINWCSEVDDDPFKRSEALASAVIRLHAWHLRGLPALPSTGREPTLVRAVKERLAEDLQARLTLPTLAAEHGVTPFVLLRAFLREAGISPHAYQQQQRVRRAITLLQSGRAVVEVAAQTGFSDQSHFTRVFRQQTSLTPKAYQSAFVSK